MDTSRFESSAKNEIRNCGGIRSAECMFIESSSPMRTFALRIFLSSLFLKRRDVSFVSVRNDASLILLDASLDTVSAGLLDAVLDGSVSRYVGTTSSVRVVSPFSSLSEDKIYAYAVQNGWNHEREPVESATNRFLDVFTKTRPGSRYALKNIAYRLSMVSRKY